MPMDKKELVYKFFLCFFLLSSIGCATTKTVSLRYSQIDFSDGISKKEAIAIVRRMYIEGEIPENIRNKVGVSFPKARYDKDIDVWWVTLTNRRGVLSLYSYIVYVDAETGKIKGQRLDQRKVPFLFQFLSSVK